MIQQSYDFIIKKIAEVSGLPVSEVEKKVKVKLVELQDLISREGAAHIVANELKVQLFDNSPKVLKIKDVSQGMNAVTLTGRVLNVYEPRSFTSGTRAGRVLNLIVGDETGSLKVVCWDDNLINDLAKVKEGDILKVKNAYTKENNGLKEVHLGGRAQIVVNPVGESVSEVRMNVGRPTAARKRIQDLVENEFVELFGTVVQVFEPKFYNACPVCNKKALPQDAGFACQEHGVVVPKSVPIVNVFFDDGSGNIRAVCFREHAERIIGAPGRLFEEVKREVAGRQLLLRGKVVKNAMFDRIEFIVAGVEEADPARLIAEMEEKV